MSMLPVETPRENLLQRIAELNENPEVNGILVQLPLPNPEDEKIVTQAVSPDKDVDGFHQLNLGRLMLREDGFTPCTPRGCMRLIHSVLPDISGLNAVVIGRHHCPKADAQLLLNGRHRHDNTFKNDGSAFCLPPSRYPGRRRRYSPLCQGRMGQRRRRCH